MDTSRYKDFHRNQLKRILMMRDKRIEELKNAVLAAYEEGWHDSRTTTSVSGHEADWVVSETKTALEQDHD